MVWRATGVCLLLVVALLWAPAAGVAADRAVDSASTSAGTADGGEDREEEERGTPYDPYWGVERSGRIPAIEKPPDLKYPKRWRYIPEGRIKPGNVFQRLLVSSFIVPLVFADSDIGVGGGVALTDIDFRQQRRREFAGIFLTYTSKGQQRYSIVWRRWMHHRELPGGGVIQEERSFWRGSMGYGKTLTRRFFGIGPDTKEEDETSYTDELSFLSAGAAFSLPDPGSNWVGEAMVRAQLHELGEGKVSGVPSTDEAFPGLFARDENSDLGILDVGIRYDTRDSQSNPYDGWYVGARAEAALLQTGWETGAVYKVDGSKVFQIPGLFHSGGTGDEENPPTDVLAAWAAVQMSSGDLPFFTLPSLGGPDTMRGYIAGRWRDRASWTAALEYRFWILTRGIHIHGPYRLERVGLALFYEAGAVAPGALDFPDSKVRHCVGFGARVSLERAAPFRVDVGFSDEGANLTARFGLPF